MPGMVNRRNFNLEHFTFEWRAHCLALRTVRVNTDANEQAFTMTMTYLGVDVLVGFVLVEIAPHLTANETYDVMAISIS
jgi:hypothetical protein